MSTDQGRRIDLHNDTRLNVASLLQEPVGSSREIRFDLDALPLDEELDARDIGGTARLTRIRDGVLVAAKLRGSVQIECVRCLREYSQPFRVDFTEEFRQTVDIQSGHDLARNRPEPAEPADEEPGFAIDENHELDLAEALRQWILLELPMRPDCGAECTGPELTQLGNDEASDSRFAALAELLPDEERA